MKNMQFLVEKQLMFLYEPMHLMECALKCLFSVSHPDFLWGCLGDKGCNGAAPRSSPL